MSRRRSCLMIPWLGLIKILLTVIIVPMMMIPIEMTLVGIVTDISDVHPQKALAANDSTGLD